MSRGISKVVVEYTFALCLCLIISCYCSSVVSNYEDIVQFNNMMLDRHNRLRTVFGLKNLTWDTDLAYRSSRWVSYCWSIGMLIHSNSTWMGENNAWRIDSSINNSSQLAKALFKQWSDEIRNYKDGRFPDNSVNGMDVSHITQILWSRTFRVGCGVIGNNDKYYTVCNYLGPGNIIGQFVM